MFVSSDMEPSTVTCNLCEQRFINGYDLVHFLSHFDLNYFKCGSKNCQAEFQSHLQLKLHVESKHRGAPKVSNFILHVLLEIKNLFMKMFIGHHKCVYCMAKLFTYL